VRNPEPKTFDIVVYPRSPRLGDRLQYLCAVYERARFPSVAPGIIGSSQASRSFRMAHPDGRPSLREFRHSQSTQLQRETLTSSGPAFVLADIDLNPIYANDAAVGILSYLIESESAEWDKAVQARLRVILQVTEYRSESLPPAPFASGRRRYVCRSFRLDGREDHARSPLVGVLMERHAELHAELLEASRRFHLSPRERETMLHLTQGLTTKEIAERMRISPNTVKQFIRLTMTKMNVTTRSGILGKLLRIS
jgi:DNA-binding CsgD family transcriptional regulator